MTTFKDSFQGMVNSLKESTQERENWRRGFAAAAHQRRDDTLREAQERTNSLRATLRESRHATELWQEEFARRTADRKARIEDAQQDRHIQLSELAAGVSHMLGRFRLESQERRRATAGMLSRDRARLDGFNAVRNAWRRDLQAGQSAWRSLSTGPAPRDGARSRKGEGGRLAR